MRSLSVLGLVLITAAFSGCSSSDNPSSGAKGDASVGGGSNGGAGGGSGDLLPDGGCPDPTMVPYGTKCLTSSAATAACIADTTKRYPTIKTSDTTCGAGCTCTYCAAEMQQCGTDPDCAAIVKCANDNNCISTACYLAAGGKDGPCKALIDHADGDAGISSNAVALAQLVNACATKTQIAHFDYSTRQGPVCNPSCM